MFARFRFRFIASTAAIWSASLSQDRFHLRPWDGPSSPFSSMLRARLHPAPLRKNRTSNGSSTCPTSPRATTSFNRQDSKVSPGQHLTSQIFPSFLSAAKSTPSHGLPTQNQDERFLAPKSPLSESTKKSRAQRPTEKELPIWLSHPDKMSSWFNEAVTWPQSTPTGIHEKERLSATCNSIDRCTDRVKRGNSNLSCGA